MLNNNIYQWIVTAEEIDFINMKYPDSRYAKNKLAFAVALKYFQINFKYPSNKNKVSDKFIAMVAEQLDNKFNENLIDFDWENRTATRFRTSIRDFLGYREPQEKDREKLIKYLKKEILPAGSDIKTSIEYSYQFLYENKIEPFKINSMNRIVRTAHHEFQNTLLNNIADKISNNFKKAIDLLLADDNIKFDKKICTATIIMTPKRQLR